MKYKWDNQYSPVWAAHNTLSPESTAGIVCFCTKKNNDLEAYVPNYSPVVISNCYPRE